MKNEVEYCEWLFMGGGPIQQKMPLAQALEKFNSKVKALRDLPKTNLVRLGSYLAIKSGRKIIKEYDEKLEVE